jgi:benzoate-CoA ligase family protein
MVDGTSAPPRLSFPRVYNAAADLLGSNLEAGRGPKIAYRDDRQAVTFAELSERAARAGNALLALGVQAEQRVLMVMLDTIDFVSTFLGAMQVGAVPVPVNTNLKPADYAHFLRDSRARALVVSDSLLPQLREGIAASPSLLKVAVAQTPIGGDPGAYPLIDELMAKALPQAHVAETTPDDTAFWLYSSGSTGLPKGAVHLHASLRYTSLHYAQQTLGLQTDEVIFSASKLFFAYGLGNSLTFPLSAGATAILRAERPTPAAVMKTLRSAGVNIFCGVPTLFAAILADPATQPGRIPGLRTSTSAGEALPRHVGEKWRATFGSDILDGIGSTEMLHIFLSNRPGDIRYGTSGKPVVGYEARLVDDSGQPTADGEEGSLWIRGGSSCSHYFNNRERSLQTFQGPWTRTGDRYIRDAEGYFTYSGRADDMIKVSGMWVSPFEVESALGLHDAVLEAAVVGHADSDELIKVKAFVVLKDPQKAVGGIEEELKAFVKGKLAPYKQPRWIELASELPKTATGKIQRFRLRG